MMATSRLSVNGWLLTFDASLFSIHAVANGGSEANGGEIGMEVFLGRWC